MTELRSLGVTREQAVRAHDFLVAYAQTSLRELGDLEAHNRETPGFTAEGDELRWTLQVDAASALRDAAEWAMLVDELDSTGLLEKSSELFRALGHAYGLLLASATFDRSSSELWAEFSQSLGDLERIASERPEDEESVDDRRRRVDYLLHYPQQQAYLMLAAAGSEEIAQEFRQPLIEILNSSPHGDGGTPVGALATPIWRFWDMSRQLLSDDYGRDLPSADYGRDRPQVIARHLSAMAGRYVESIRAARGNERLWGNAAAPVDVVDLDIALIAAVTVRRFGRRAIDALNATREQLGDLASIPIKAGIQLATPGEGMIYI